MSKSSVQSSVSSITRKVGSWWTFLKCSTADWDKLNYVLWSASDLVYTATRWWGSAEDVMLAPELFIKFVFDDRWQTKNPCLVAASKGHRKNFILIATLSESVSVHPSILVDCFASISSSLGT